MIHLIHLNKKMTKKRKRNIKNEEIIDESCLSEKDVKRQQRLIKKQRISPSFKRKKKNLCKGIRRKFKKNLSNSNSNLNSKVNSLEEENQILRQQLERAIKGEKIEKPVLKKKINNTNQNNLSKKLPLPPLQQMPFLTPQYWTGLFYGGNNPVNNNSNNGTNPKVVLFIALFCVALFLVKPGSFLGNEKIDTKNIGRVIQSLKESNIENLEVDQLYVTLQNLEKNEVSSKLKKM